MTEVNVREIETRNTILGPALYIKICTEDYRRLGWEEVWEAFAREYPGKWGVEVYPPESELVNGKNCYHLFVIDFEPIGLNIR